MAKCKALTGSAVKGLNLGRGSGERGYSLSGVLGGTPADIEFSTF